MTECSMKLSQGRKKRELPEGLATPEDLASYQLLGSQPLHKTGKVRDCFRGCMLFRIVQEKMWLATCCLSWLSSAAAPAAEPYRFASLVCTPLNGVLRIR